MFLELVKVLHHALVFLEISPDFISKIDSKVGFIWFKAGKQTYWVEIRKASFDLDDYSDNEQGKFKISI